MHLKFSIFHVICRDSQFCEMTSCGVLVCQNVGEIRINKFAPSEVMVMFQNCNPSVQLPEYT